MAIKRSLELSGDDDDEHSLSAAVHEPPAKRRLLSTPKRHPLTTNTPLPSQPLDSPSNPFGRKRIHALTRSLPPPTSFSKHLPLRFQLVRPGLSPRLGGTHRIVQVPLSYTFVHLRCLIAFLYGEGYVPPQQDRHLFEVQKRLVMYSLTYKPGQIRSGVTTVKLSSARDPCRYRPEVDEDAFMTQPDASGEDSPAEDVEETERWVWEAEEHFTLAHAWPRGGDLARGIIYHHAPDTAVHITINTTSIPRRKGISNVPYVFNARGRIRILPRAPSPLPRPVFSVPFDKLSIPSSPIRPSVPRPEEDDDADGDTDTEYDDASRTGLFECDNPSGEEDQDSESEEEQEDVSITLSPTKFNTPNAFAAYLKATYLHNHSPDSDSDEDPITPTSPPSTPGLVHSHPSSSSPVSSSSPFSFKFSSSSPVSVRIAGSSSPALSRTLRYPSSTYKYSKLKYPTSAYTPAPPHAPWHRRRIARVEKRMERLKKGAYMCAKDESEEDGEAVDELGGEVQEAAVKPAAAEEWDPFGDRDEDEVQSDEC